MVLFFGFLNFAEKNRKYFNDAYPDRFIQDIDYRYLNIKERRSSKKKNYKYEMIQDRSIYTLIMGYRIQHKYFDLYEDGRLVIKKGYRSDGPSGVTIDTASFMRGAFMHDVLFQCLRENLFKLLTSVKSPCQTCFLDDDKWRELFDIANSELKRICVNDGMLKSRGYIVEKAVKNFGSQYALPKCQNE